MVALRRTLIVVIALVAPVVATALIYVVTVFLLRATNRTIDPHILYFASIVEFVVFLFLALLEVKNRW